MGTSGPELLHDPLRHRLQLGVGIILAGDQQGGELEPDLRFVLEILQRLQHRLQVAAADLPSRNPR